MNIYLDESYNLQKSKGKQFISINGFAVLNDRNVRKEWKVIRKKYSGKRRIHATDSRFSKLSDKSIKLLGRHDATILSIFQIIQEVDKSKRYFSKDKIDFEKVYLELVKLLMTEISLDKHKLVRIIIDSKKHKGGIVAEKRFEQDISMFLKSKYSKTKCDFRRTPSYTDMLVELADFVSNRFYKEYQKGSKYKFNQLGLKIIQIKNPL